MVKKDMKKIIAGTAVGALVISAVLGGAGVALIPSDNTAIIAEAFENGVASVDVNGIAATSFENGVASVPACDVCEVCAEPATIIQNVTQEVEVDNGNLALVLDEIYDNDGKVQYLTEDLDDDELDLIVDRIVFISEAKELAIKEVKDQLADELDNVEITLNDNSTYEFDEDDFEKIRLDDDEDEITVDNIDYEDKDVDVTVTGKFRHDDVWFNFEAQVAIEDNEVDDFDIISVTEE